MIFIKINGTALRTVYPEVASSNLVRLALESLPALGRLFSWGGLEWNLRKAHDLAHGFGPLRTHAPIVEDDQDIGEPDGSVTINIGGAIIGCWLTIVAGAAFGPGAAHRGAV